MRLEGKKEGVSTNTACPHQNLSPGQIGGQRPHCSPAAGAAPGANDFNQICVIGLRKKLNV